jgi:hypothetical protein
MSIHKDLELLTLDPDMDNDSLPEGGFINDDSHLLDFVANYFEDEMLDEPDYEDFYYEDLIHADEGIESRLDVEDTYSY